MSEPIMSPQTRMILALTALGKQVYEGTVAWNVIEKRRAKNKLARRSRRINRK